MSIYSYAPDNAVYIRGVTREVTGPTQAEAHAEGIHIVVGGFFPLSADGFVHPTLAGYTAYAEPTLGEVGPSEEALADGVGFVVVGSVNPGWQTQPGFNYLGYETVRQPTWHGEYLDAPYGKLGSSGMVNPGYLSRPGYNYDKFVTPGRSPVFEGEFADRPFGILGSSGVGFLPFVVPAAAAAGRAIAREVRMTPEEREARRARRRSRRDERRARREARRAERQGTPESALPQEVTPNAVSSGFVTPGYITRPGFNYDGFVTPDRHPVYEAGYADRPFGILGSSGIGIPGVGAIVGPRRRARRIARLRERWDDRASGAFQDGTGTPVGEVNGYDFGAVGAFGDAVGLMYVERSNQGRILPRATYGEKDTFIGRNITNDVGVDYEYYLGQPADGPAVPVSGLHVGAVEAVADAVRVYDIEGAGYKYERLPDGTITVLSGPSSDRGTFPRTLEQGSTAHAAADRRITEYVALARQGRLAGSKGTVEFFAYDAEDDETPSPAGEGAEKRALRAAKALRKWAERQMIPVISAWKASDGSAHGHLFTLESDNDLDDLRNKAKQIALLRRVHFSIKPYADEQYKAFFTADPKTMDVDVEDAMAQGIEVGRIFARRPLLRPPMGGRRPLFRAPIFRRRAIRRAVRQARSAPPPITEVPGEDGLPLILAASSGWGSL